jgi:hypothetical protein
MADDDSMHLQDPNSDLGCSRETSPAATSTAPVITGWEFHDRSPGDHSGESSLIHRSLGTQSFPRGLREDEYYLFKLDDAAKGTVRLSDGTDIQPRRVQLEIASDRKTWDVWYHVVVEEGDGEKGYLVRDRALLRWVEYTGAGCDTEPAAGSGAEAERELSIGEQWRQRSLTRFSLANVGNQDESEYPNAKFKRLSGTEDPRECLFQEGLPTVHLKLLKVPDPQREIVENNVLLFEPDPEDLSRYLQTLPSAAAFGDTGSSSSTTGRVSFGSGLPASSLPTEPTAVPARRNKVSLSHPVSAPRSNVCHSNRTAETVYQYASLMFSSHVAHEGTGSFSTSLFFRRFTCHPEHYPLLIPFCHHLSIGCLPRLLIPAQPSHVLEFHLSCFQTCFQAPLFPLHGTQPPRREFVRCPVL